MGWLRVLASECFDDPAGVITDIATEELEVEGEKAGRLTLHYRVRDVRREPFAAAAEVYLPASLADDPESKLPVWVNCHYTVDAEVAAQHLRLGRAVATPCDPPEGSVPKGTNPLHRGPNAGIVLSHLIRGASFADPTAIVYGGGSAGGGAALMLIAEAFPAAAGIALGPPVNQGYEAAYIATVYPRFVADPPDGFPIIQMITMGFAAAVPAHQAAYGHDFGARPFFEHSPVAHVDRITCPVFVMTSTADFLVPVDQFSREFASATIADPPKHVTIAAEDLHDSELVSTRLVDVLGDRADVRRVPLPDGAVEQLALDLTMQQVDKMPVEVASAPADGKQWLVNFLDEGPIVLGATHGRFAVTADFEPFVRTALDGGIGLDQLTATKLDQLLDRYAGVEWLADGFVHLDEPEAERADVLRGLRVYCAQSAAHAERFAELYAQVPDERRVLPDL